MEGNGRAVNILHLLKGQDFILQNRTQHTRLIVDRIFHKRHIEPHIEPYIILETSNIQAEAELAARNYGFTFITETHLKYIPNRDQLALFSIGSPKTTVDFVATYRKNSYLPFHAKEYIKVVKEFTWYVSRIQNAHIETTLPVKSLFSQRLVL